MSDTLLKYVFCSGYENWPGRIEENSFILSGRRRLTNRSLQQVLIIHRNCIRVSEMEARTGFKAFNSIIAQFVILF